MSILSVYIFHVGVNQQLYGQPCNAEHRVCMRAGAIVQFHQVELDSRH